MGFNLTTSYWSGKRGSEYLGSLGSLNFLSYSQVRSNRNERQSLKKEKRGPNNQCSDETGALLAHFF